MIAPTAARSSSRHQVLALGRRDLKIEMTYHFDQLIQMLSIVFPVATYFYIAQLVGSSPELAEYRGGDRLRFAEVVRTLNPDSDLVRDLSEADPMAAEIVAAECVVLAETKDHQNWELLGQTLKAAPANYVEAIQAPWEEVEGQEDEHLYHTRGWARELWFQSLGLPAQLPPPEEEQNVSSMAEAAQVEEERKNR